MNCHSNKSKFHNKSPDFICEIRNGSGLAKAESIFHKIFDRSKRTWVGGIVICGVVPQNLKILWNSLPLFCDNISWSDVFFVESDLWIRVFAKAEFTNQIPQKIRTKKYGGIPQNKGHEFHNIFKFCGTTFFFDRSIILWKIDSAFASPLPLRIPQIKSGLFLWNLDRKSVV